MSTSPEQNGSRVLVTAGPTQEPVDAVRYLSNRSSGRMGICLAVAAANRGWPTTLLLGPGPSSPPDHSQLETLRFRTTADLQHLMQTSWPAHDVLLMVAAVSDYRPREDHAGEKLRRRGEGLVLDLEPTPDLLAEAVRTRHAGQLIVGFALEPAAGLEQAAHAKLARKGIDAIVANPLETMDARDVTATMLLADGRSLTPPPGLPKPVFAEWLLDRIKEELGLRGRGSG